MSDCSGKGSKIRSLDFLDSLSLSPKVIVKLIVVLNKERIKNLKMVKKKIPRKLSYF